jgi:hypothetical protein
MGSVQVEADYFGLADLKREVDGVIKGEQKEAGEKDAEEKAYREKKDLEEKDEKKYRRKKDWEEKEYRESMLYCAGKSALNAERTGHNTHAGVVRFLGEMRDHAEDAVGDGAW